MSAANNCNDLSFLKRALRDASTGAIHLSKKDQKFLKRRFSNAGQDVTKPFKDEESLIRAHIDSLDLTEFLMVYEHTRILQLDDPDRFEPLGDWTGFNPYQCNVIRILARLIYLGIPNLDESDIWIAEHCGIQFVKDRKIAYGDKSMMSQLEDMLDEMIRSIKKAKCDESAADY